MDALPVIVKRIAQITWLHRRLLQAAPRKSTLRGSNLREKA